MNHQSEDKMNFSIGDIVELTPEKVAHGGSFVARANGRVFFVRHSLPGETVRAVITGSGPKTRFFFADTVEVLSASANRRQHPWAPADALLAAQENRLPVGGMEFGHITPSVQQELKAVVIAEQLQRLGGIAADHPLLEQLTVKPVSEKELGQRTRVHFGVDAQRHIAMYPHQSNEPQTVGGFPLAAAALENLHLEQLELSGISRVDAAVSSTGQRFVQFTVGAENKPAVVAENLKPQLEQLWGDLQEQRIAVRFTAERISGRGRGVRAADVLWGDPVLQENVSFEGAKLNFEVDGAGFWQNHAAAPATLSALVREFADLKSGETAFDLYAGAGLLTGVLADAVGEKGHVLSVEGSPVTSSNAEKNFARQGISRTERSSKTVIKVVRGDVAKVLRSVSTKPEYRAFTRPDVVVLDPSREGAGRQVMEQIDQLDPRAIVYVACDPAALGRDTGYLRELGWSLVKVQGLDMYPCTHHVETIARFERR